MSRDDTEPGAYGFEGWDTDGVADTHVRRFAKPPYTWRRVRRDRFSAAERRRHDDPTLEAEVSGR
jgi:hypothetical protein